MRIQLYMFQRICSLHCSPRSFLSCHLEWVLDQRRSLVVCWLYSSCNLLLWCIRFLLISFHFLLENHLSLNVVKLFRSFILPLAYLRLRLLWRRERHYYRRGATLLVTAEIIFKILIFFGVFPICAFSIIIGKSMTISNLLNDFLVDIFLMVYTIVIFWVIERGCWASHVLSVVAYLVSLLSHVVILGPFKIISAYLGSSNLAQKPQFVTIVLTNLICHSWSFFSTKISPVNISIIFRCIFDYLFLLFNRASNSSLLPLKIG